MNIPLMVSFENGMAILYAVLLLIGLGAIFAVLLCIFYVVFKVKEDKRVEEVEKLLPGYNCGACGNAGCHEMAEKLVKGEISDIKICRPGKKEANFDPIMSYLSSHPDPVYEDEEKKEEEKK